MEAQTLKTSYGELIFAFSDCDYEERMNTYKEMKEYAKKNYKKEYWDVHFAAFGYNSYYNCIEPIDGIEVTSKTSKKTYNEFIERIKKEYLK